ncbi:YgcG family protein [Nonlabens sp.]|uniref:TPM domain-containing protein n=1 Tax=Nonlabens sp. TaxID=1888209 RepID=UPI001BCF1A59|nr:TPM domain-containing protein [Nonlabens sp.]
MKYFLYLILAFLSCSQLAQAQFDIPNRPSNGQQIFVYDYADLLPKAQKETLNLKLKRYADTTSTQIVFAIISTANGEELDELGAKWGQEWGIGQKGKDNGILLILAVNDRKVDINTGFGIESILSDADAERIVNRVLVPNFRNKNYYQGLDQGADAIFQGLQGEFKGSGATSDRIPWSLLLIIGVFLLILILNLRNKNKGNGTRGGRNAGPSLLDIIVLSSLGRGGFGGGGSGSGGGFGGGFGGGGFGGGGAGGSW